MRDPQRDAASNASQMIITGSDEVVYSATGYEHETMHSRASQFPFPFEPTNPVGVWDAFERTNHRVLIAGVDYTCNIIVDLQYKIQQSGNHLCDFTIFWTKLIS